MRDRLTMNQKMRMMTFLTAHPHARLEVEQRGAIRRVSIVAGRHRRHLFRRDTARGPSRVNPFRMERGYREYFSLLAEATDLLRLGDAVRPMMEARGAARARIDAEEEIALLHRLIAEKDAEIQRLETRDREERAARHRRLFEARRPAGGTATTPRIPS